MWQNDFSLSERIMGEREREICTVPKCQGIICKFCDKQGKKTHISKLHNCKNWMESALWTKSMRTNLHIILKRCQRVNSDPIDPSFQPRVNNTDIIAICGATPHSTETWLSHDADWIRTVTASMSKIYTVIEIYIILIILSFWSRLLSDKLPLPGLQHPAAMFNLRPSHPSAFGAQWFLPSLNLFLSVDDLRRVQTCSLKKMWHIWASIDESGPLTGANICVLTAKTIYITCNEKECFMCLMT